MRLASALQDVTPATPGQVEDTAAQDKAKQENAAGKAPTSLPLPQFEGVQIEMLPEIDAIILRGRDQQGVRSGQRAARDRSRHRAGRIPHAAQSLRIGQDHFAQHLRRVSTAFGRPCARRRNQHRRVVRCQFYHIRRKRRQLG